MVLDYGVPRALTLAQVAPQMVFVALLAVPPSSRWCARPPPDFWARGSSYARPLIRASCRFTRRSAPSACHTRLHGPRRAHCGYSARSVERRIRASADGGAGRGCSPRRASCRGYPPQSPSVIATQCGIRVATDDVADGGRSVAQRPRALGAGDAARRPPDAPTIAAAAAQAAVTISGRASRRRRRALCSEEVCGGRRRARHVRPHAADASSTSSTTFHEYAGRALAQGKVRRGDRAVSPLILKMVPQYAAAAVRLADVYFQQQRFRRSGDGIRGVPRRATAARPGPWTELWNLALFEIGQGEQAHQTTRSGRGRARAAQSAERAAISPTLTGAARPDAALRARRVRPLRDRCASECRATSSRASSRESPGPVGSRFSAFDVVIAIAARRRARGLCATDDAARPP
mgnify:CR=1 FL=1